jgi:AAA domain
MKGPLPPVERMRLFPVPMALDSPVRRREDEEAEVPLSGVRAEFRTALRAEIEAAKRAVAASATALEAGRRMGRHADAVLYVFSAPSAISVASDSPGELIIEGFPPLEAVVVSVEGLDVTVSVPVDLGDRVPRAVLRRDLVLPLRRLIARIEEAGSTPNPAGDRLLGGAPASGAPEVIDDALLDSAQAAALGSSLGRDITFVLGPPGAGKTRTIGSIGAHLYRRGRSMLLVAHTNRAADQALVEIAERLGDELGAGAMLRLGIPSDRRLLEREDLLLDAVVWKRQAELRDREARLRAQRAATQRRLAECERLIGVAAWAGEGRAELADFLLRLDALHSWETSARRLVEEVARGARGEAELLARLAEGQAAARAAKEARRLCAQLAQLAAELDAAGDTAAVADAAVTRARRDYEKAVELEPLFARERALGPLAEQRRAAEALAVREAEARRQRDAARETVRQAQELHATASSATGSTRRFRGFWFQVRFRRVAAQPRARLAAAQARLEGISGRLARASAVLAELEELDRQLAPFRKLESAAKQEAHLQRREAERGLAAATQTQLDHRRETVEQQLAQAAAAVEQFRDFRATEPSGLVARIEPQLAELRHLREKLHETEQRASDLRKALDADLSMRLAAIEALALGHGSSRENAEERFVEVALAQSEATRLATEIDVAAAETEVTDGHREQDAIDKALARIDHQLEATGQTVIADSRVVATTLTRVYLGNELHDRRFDTVILDDASMAPIPALWIAARLADANVVVLGDLRQRPPIKQSEHPLADKWLGQDIFDASRVRSARDRSTPPPTVIQLDEGADATTGS